MIAQASLRFDCHVHIYSMVCRAVGAPVEGLREHRLGGAVGGGHLRNEWKRWVGKQEERKRSEQ
jgi:hypothetical protein